MYCLFFLLQLTFFQLTINSIYLNHTKLLIWKALTKKKKIQLKTRKPLNWKTISRTHIYICTAPPHYSIFVHKIFSNLIFMYFFFSSLTLLALFFLPKMQRTLSLPVSDSHYKKTAPVFTLHITLSPQPGPLGVTNYDTFGTDHLWYELSFFKDCFSSLL